MSDKIVTNEELGSNVVNEVTGTKVGNKNSMDVYIIGGLEDMIGGTIPAGGTTGQHLAKSSNDAYETEWVTPHEVPAGGTTGQVLSKINNTDYNTQWATVNANPGGSDTQVQFNDGGAFGGDSNFIWDKTNDSLNIQTTLKQHPIHANATTGQTINNVASASVVQTTEALNTSPTGTITLIQEFVAPSGSGTSQNTSGSGYTASGQSIDYNIYGVILVDGVYYSSQFYESINFTDTLNDSSPFSVDINFPTAASEQTHWLISKQVNGGGFNDTVLHSIGTNYEDQAFSGTVSTSSWPTYYTLSYTTPTAPNTDSAQEINIGSGNLTEANITYGWEIRSAANVASVLFCEQTGLTGNSFTDANMANTFDLQIDWTPGTGDDQIIRITTDGGSNWTYHQVGSMTGQFIYTGQSNDSVAETAWSNDIAGADKEYAFKCYARTQAPSSGGYVFTLSANTYYATVVTPSVNYIFKHSLSGLTGAGGKILGDYNAGVTNGKIVTADFYDIGYGNWADGTTLTPNHFGFTGTAQVREYKLYGYSGSLLIYSGTAFTVASSDTGGYKYNTISFSYPSGVTTVKITRGINGAAHNVSATLNSPTASIIDDDLSNSWNGNTTVTPNTATPSTARFDQVRTTISQNTDNVIICETSGSGSRYPSLIFALAANTNSAHSSILARLSAFSGSGRLQIGAGGVEGYNSTSMGTQSFNLGHSNDFNLAKSSTIHMTVWAADASNPMMYAYAAGDSNRGTVYFGQNSTSFGNSSKVVIAPTAGGTIGLHFRRTSGFSGDCILIDEAGSFKAGWGQSGRMYLNSSAVSTTTYLLIGGTSSGSQMRLAAQSATGSVEGDIWNDSTSKVLTTFNDGIKQYLQGVIFTQTASGTCANTTTETTISSTGVGTLSLPANFFVAGKTLKIKAFGFHSSTANPNLTIKIKLGSTVVLTTGAHAVHNGTNHLIEIDALITCRTTGGSGTVFAQGMVHDNTDNIQMVNTAATTIATTSGQNITVTAQWGTASASNTITLTNLVVEVLA